MRLTLAILYFFLHLTAVCSQENDPALKITPLAGNCYVYTTYRDYDGSPFPSNSMYLVTKKGVVLFDTPWDTTQFQPLLDSIAARHNKQVVLCVSTHYHDDRTAVLDYYRQKGIRTYTSKQTWELCARHGEKQAEFFFEKDTTFKVGGYRFETFYPGEGHTKDNIVIWLKKEKILYGGCLVKSTEHPNLGNVADANLAEYGPSLKKVMRKYPQRRFVIPGHLGWGSNQGLEHTLKLLEQRK